ncbi:MAG: helix-turn-helix domain-containing protein [Actinomycetes bacterium]
MTQETFKPDSAAAQEAARLARSLHDQTLPEWFQHYFMPAIESIAAEHPVTILLDEDDPELTPSDVGRILRVSRSTVSRLITNGKIPSRKVGGHHRVKLNDVRRYMEDYSDRSSDYMRRTLAALDEYGDVSTEEYELAKREWRRSRHE